MNMIQSFNNTIDYIETVLEDQIDEKKIALLSGYSYAMFSRLFSILTNMSLSKYIRHRKLSEAAILLKNTNQKIIDIAITFGYESPDSFSVAFKIFHGFTPSEVRKGQSFNTFSRIQLALTVQGGQIMNHTTQNIKECTVVDVTAQTIHQCLCIINSENNTEMATQCCHGDCQCQVNECTCNKE